MESESLISLALRVIGSRITTTGLIRVPKSTSSVTILHGIHAEKGLEYFIKLIKLLITGMSLRMIMRSISCLLLFRSESVIPLFLLRIDEDCICVWYFLEYVFCAWISYKKSTIVAVFIGMEFECEFLVGFFDLGLVGSFRYTENVIVLLFPHHDGDLFLGLSLFFVHAFQLC